MYRAFVWARRALNSPKRLPARAVPAPAVEKVAAPKKPEPEPEPEPAAAAPVLRESDRLIAELLGGGPAREPLRPSLTAQLSKAVSGAEEVANFRPACHCDRAQSAGSYAPTAPSLSGRDRPR